MALPESGVLHPRDPSLTSTDDWPIFSLSGVYITAESTGKPTSLLSAHRDHPVKVIGRLNKIDAEAAHCIKNSSYRSVTIEISEVKVYAFAEYDDGTYGFWAAGQAGWFQIDRVMPKYQSFFLEMSIAASMLYCIADKSRRSRKSASTQSDTTKQVARTFKDYCSMAKYPLEFTDIEDVRNGFNEHHEFLISSMFEGQEGINWQDAPMMKYFSSAFPGDVARIQSRVLNTTLPVSRVDSETTERKSPSPPSPPSAMDTKVKKRRGRPPKALQAAQQKPASTPHEDSSVRSILDDDYDDNDNEEYGMPRKRKSILRPSGRKSAKKARKAIERYGSHTSLNETPLGNDVEDEEQDPALQSELSPITTISSGRQLYALTNGRKKKDSSDSPPPPDFLPRKFFELRVVDYDVYSLDPQGPGDLWTCPFEDCGRRIHKASTLQGKETVREHFETHKGSKEDRINLVLNESRPYLPVDHLVRRLQAAASATNGDDLESPGRKFAAPIRRRY